MTDQVLFTEIFPLTAAAVPPLTAYQLTFDGTPPHDLGGWLAARLDRAFPGHWVWAGRRILTDSPVTAVEMQITLDILHDKSAERVAGLLSIDEIANWKAPPRARVDFLLRTRIRELDEKLREALHQHTIRLKGASVERDCRLRPWVVQDEPALSLSILSGLLYEKRLDEALAERPKAKEAVGWWVRCQPANIAGEITAITGTVSALRDDLLQSTRRGSLREIIRNASDTAPVVRVKSGEQTYDIPASALDIIIRLDAEEKFGIDTDQATRALRLAPDVRSQLVRAVSDVLKGAGLINSAYNARTHPDHFSLESGTADLLFAKNRVRPYQTETLADDFARNGVYQRHRRFQDKPVTIAVINTLDEKIDDFVEAMRRQLERQFDTAITLLRERRVRVLSEKNLESAVRVVEKEEPHLVLAFFPDELEDDESDQDADALYRHLKSLTVGKGIASHAVYQSVMHDPDAMSRMIMGVLGKTGNTPFVLDEPLPYADFVVGLDMLRESKRDHDRVFAMARIYHNDGRFIRYILHHAELDPDEPIPLIVMQTLFPMDAFGGKRVLIHHSGVVSAGTRAVLDRWGDVLKTDFYPVEITAAGTPRLYALEKKRGVVAPARGSSFILDDTAALLVTEAEPEGVTPRPLHINVLNPQLPVDRALHSVLMWTLLHYGAPRPSKLPVTVQYADEMAHWLARGILPAEIEGDVPFWL